MKIKPMTDAEWVEFGKATLHGPPPWKTILRIFATVERLIVERGEFHLEVRRLKGIVDRAIDESDETNTKSASDAVQDMLAVLCEAEDESSED